MKAIHNDVKEYQVYILLFQTTKIQTFESNSQLAAESANRTFGCFRLQRYKLLKAIHNVTVIFVLFALVVSDYKDTNFLKAIHNCSSFILCKASVVSDYKDINFLKAIHDGTLMRLFVGKRLRLCPA